jgi:hypothetical protein
MKNKIIKKLIYWLLSKYTGLHIFIHLEDVDKENYKINVTRNIKKQMAKNVLVVSYDCVDEDNQQEKQINK